MDVVAAAWQDFYSLKKVYNLSNQPILPKCRECNNFDLVYDQSKDETICPHCGLVQHFNFHFMRNNIEYLPDTSNKVKKSVYRHQDYLNRKLDELSCARVCIDEDLYNKVLLVLGDSTVSVCKLKRILRALGHKQKFLQIPTILNMIDPDKYPPIKLNYHQRDKFEKMFLRYIDTFFIMKNKGDIKRKNLLNYNFVFYKLFEMLEFKIIKTFFELPKGRKTLENHEIVWKQICKYNNWLRK